MNENPNLITIPQDKYNKLLKAEYKLEMLEKLIFESVCCDDHYFDAWFNNEKINFAFKTIFGKDVLAEVRKQKAKEAGEK